MALKPAPVLGASFPLPPTWLISKAANHALVARAEATSTPLVLLPFLGTSRLLSPLSFGERPSFTRIVRQALLLAKRCFVITWTESFQRGAIAAFVCNTATHE
ncbi:hypothetical protein MRX96_025009 [Rhipicephalus microplus]